MWRAEPALPADSAIVLDTASVQMPFAVLLARRSVSPVPHATHRLLFYCSTRLRARVCHAPGPVHHDGPGQ